MSTCAPSHPSAATALVQPPSQHANPLLAAYAPPPPGATGKSPPCSPWSCPQPFENLNAQGLPMTSGPQVSGEAEVMGNLNNGTQEPIAGGATAGGTGKKKGRPKMTDKFDGLTEEEVAQKSLPDYLKENLDIVVVGINPSLTSAHVGHHYAGPGNHFWACVSDANLVPSGGPVSCYDDLRMLEWGMGFTNVCTRPTKGAAELSRKEMKEGTQILLQKLRRYRPKIACFNGKGIYESFIGHKNFYMGKQPDPIPGTDIIVYVMPSSSARCAQLPRAADKLPFYTALRKLRDHVQRNTPLDESDVVFPDYTEMRVSQPDPKSLLKAERRRKRKALEMASSSTSGRESSGAGAGGAGGGTRSSRGSSTSGSMNSEAEIAPPPSSRSKESTNTASVAVTAAQSSTSSSSSSSSSSSCSVAQTAGEEPAAVKAEESNSSIGSCGGEKPPCITPTPLPAQGAAPEQATPPLAGGPPQQMRCSPPTGNPLPHIGSLGGMSTGSYPPMTHPGIPGAPPQHPPQHFHHHPAEYPSPGPIMTGGGMHPSFYSSQSQLPPPPPPAGYPVHPQPQGAYYPGPPAPQYHYSAAPDCYPPSVYSQPSYSQPPPPPPPPQHHMGVPMNHNGNEAGIYPPAVTYQNMTSHLQQQQPPPENTMSNWSFREANREQAEFGQPVMTGTTSAMALLCQGKNGLNEPSSMQSGTPSTFVSSPRSTDEYPFHHATVNGHSTLLSSEFRPAKEENVKEEEEDDEKPIYISL